MALVRLTEMQMMLLVEFPVLDCKLAVAKNQGLIG
jgi:hypothetical protein